MKRDCEFSQSRFMRNLGKPRGFLHETVFLREPSMIPLGFLWVSSEVSCIIVVLLRVSCVGFLLGFL